MNWRIREGNCAIECEDRKWDNWGYIELLKKKGKEESDLLEKNWIPEGKLREEGELEIESSTK